jgi:hypothetical protein
METKWDKPGKDAADKGKGKSKGKNKNKGAPLEQDWECSITFHREDFDGDGSIDYRLIHETKVNGDLFHGVELTYYGVNDETAKEIEAAFTHSGLANASSEKYDKFRDVLKLWKKGIQGLKHLNDRGFELADQNKLP